jgi:hypothetical protein
VAIGVICDKTPSFNLTLSKFVFPLDTVNRLKQKGKTSSVRGISFEALNELNRYHRPLSVHAIRHKAPGGWATVDIRGAYRTQLECWSVLEQDPLYFVLNAQVS